MKKFWREGEPFVWATGAAMSLTLLVTATLVMVVMINGLGVFWPSDVTRVTLENDQQVMGEIIQREPLPSGDGERLQFKIGNRDLYGLDFRWIDQQDIVATDIPESAIVLERYEYGNFYGELSQVEMPGYSGGTTRVLEEALDAVAQKRRLLQEYEEQIHDLNREAAGLERSKGKLLYAGSSAASPEVVAIDRQVEELRSAFEQVVSRQEAASRELNSYTVTVRDAAGTAKAIPLSHIVRVYQPNTMSSSDKVLFYLSKLAELFVGEPRESNTEGGLFPAIFGTIMLIFLMSLFSFPLGVIAAVYLREYAKEGPVVRMVRIAVNNLAGIPSIVYGIFGLGFFVYGIGAGIDQLFFPERLPTPTFGTGGILWASLTLALLTVPVVIVSTEEALSAIPGGIREGSLALGSTKFQTLVRILLPMASPGIMTGLILAMARAAGEVAPLMITGVVKLAPALPLDGTFPFLHLDRKFMHLGFHIYDIGFQSPNVEAAKPMVFVTTLLLVLIVLLMSSVAIYLRNKMKKRFTYGTF